MKNLSAVLLADFYKLSHRPCYPPNTSKVYSTWTPRESRIKEIKEVVVFGNQAAVTDLLDIFEENFFSKPKEDVIAEYVRIVKHTLGDQNPETKHLEDLHDLGYLPLLIKGLPEGTKVPLRVPTLTIENTDPRFFWLTNYVETFLSCSLWQSYTSATLAYEYRKLLDESAMKTVGNTDFVPFQGHDFSMRGLSSLESAMKSGMGHLLSFVGTDTIPAIQAAEYYYGANVEKEMVGTSIPATEHSIQCAYGNDRHYLDRMLSVVHPKGFISIVSDGYDFWDVIGRVILSLKNKIMARDGRVVIRPDSGDPVLVVCGDPDGKTELERKGAVEALWDIFGGTTTEKGYKLLDPHIGLIYGDAITLFRAKEIISRLEAKGFASINVVFGIGSFTYQLNTRDTFGFALKSTLCIIDGEEKQIFKNPKTDSGIKKSQKGKVVVYQDPATQEIKYADGYSLNDSVYIRLNDKDVDLDMLQPIFRDGLLINPTTFAKIRSRLAGNK